MLGNWSGDLLKSKFRGSSSNSIDSVKMEMGFNKGYEEENKVSGILILSLVLFLVFVILTIGSFIYSLSLDRKIASLENTFNTQRDTFKVDVIKSINNFSRQTEGIKRLIDEKSDVSVALRQASELAHQDTQYTRLGLQRSKTDTYNLSLSAVTSSLRSYLQQLRSISKSKTFGESGVVTGTRVIDGKKVVFSFNSSIYIDKNADEYEDIEETEEIDESEEVDVELNEEVSREAKRESDGEGGEGEDNNLDG